MSGIEKRATIIDKDDNSILTDYKRIIIKDGIDNTTIPDSKTRKFTKKWINDNLKKFLTSLTCNYGSDYSDFDPFISGNYGVFMQHGTWFETLKSYNIDIPAPVKNYISLMDGDYLKNINLNDSIYGKETENILKFSQLITDIQVPEPSKEYMAISTRQKNSFINTRDYVGSDFSINALDNKKLELMKYMEAWHKSIDLIREGLFFNDEALKKYLKNIESEDYLINNPYCNTIWIALFDSKGIELKGIIALFGVMPVNLPLKNMIGDRGSPKITTYSLNFKFMDLQYKFIDGWEQLNDIAGDDIAGNLLAKKFRNFLAYSSDTDTDTNKGN